MAAEQGAHSMPITRRLASIAVVVLAALFALPMATMLADGWWWIFTGHSLSGVAWAADDGVRPFLAPLMTIGALPCVFVWEAINDDD